MGFENRVTVRYLEGTCRGFPVASKLSPVQPFEGQCFQAPPRSIDGTQQPERFFFGLRSFLVGGVRKAPIQQGVYSGALGERATLLAAAASRSTVVNYVLEVCFGSYSQGALHRSC